MSLHLPEARDPTTHYAVRYRRSSTFRKVAMRPLHSEMVANQQIYKEWSCQLALPGRAPLHSFQHMRQGCPQM